jgi:hypothetical protein
VEEKEGPYRAIQTKTKIRRKKNAWKMELGFDFCAETLNPVTPKQLQGNDRLKIVKNSYIQGHNTLLTSAAFLHPQPPVVPGTTQHQRWQKILHLPNMMRPDFQVGCKCIIGKDNAHVASTELHP